MTKDANVDLTEDVAFYLGWSLLYKPVCVPKSWSKEQVEAEVNKEPPGTSANRWVCTEISEACPENPVQCIDDCNRQHWLFNC